MYLHVHNTHKRWLSCTCMSTIHTKGGYHVLVYKECMCFEPAVLRFCILYLNMAHVFTAVLHTISLAYTGWSEEDSGAEEGRERAGCPIEVIMTHYLKPQALCVALSL